MCQKFYVSNGLDVFRCGSVPGISLPIHEDMEEMVERFHFMILKFYTEFYYQKVVQLTLLAFSNIRNPLVYCPGTFDTNFSAYLMRILMMIMITNDEEECNDERMDKTNPDPKRHIRWMWMDGIGW